MHVRAPLVSYVLDREQVCVCPHLLIQLSWDVIFEAKSKHISTVIRCKRCDVTLNARPCKFCQT